MSSVLLFKNFTYYDDNHPTPTIAGEQFHTLMELCFVHADAFSLHRCGWPGAKNGALEDALRPWLLGEYLSYGILNWFDLKRREKCYLYRACPETKDILLQHFHHLFDQEASLEPPGHQEYLRQKYEVYQRAGEEANDIFFAYLDGEGQAHSEEQQEKVMERIYREARERCPNVFSEEDHYSHMEDPCFFRGTEMFFEIITHERECLVQVLSLEFEKSLRKLGTWVDISAESRLPLFLLNEAKGFKRYECGNEVCEMKANIEKTQAFYCNFPPEYTCNCAHCRHYRAKIREAYPEVAEYLATLGVDIEKPFEISPLESDENGYLEYCICQYIVFGTCPEDYTYQIGEVRFGISDCHPSTGIDEEHFVLDFYPIKLRFEISEGK